MPDIPGYLKPVVGFCMWHLLGGVDSEDVMEKLAVDKRYGHLKRRDHRRALAQARRNLGPSLRCQQLCAAITEENRAENPEEAARADELLKLLTLEELYKETSRE